MRSTDLRPYTRLLDPALFRTWPCRAETHKIIASGLFHNAQLKLDIAHVTINSIGRFMESSAG